MKKLDKDQTQKIFLSSLLMLGLIYCYFTFLIGPLNRAYKFNTEAIEQLDAKLAQARTKVLRARNLQEEAHKADEILAQINDQIPEGAPIAWFPPRMKAFFDRHNIKDTIVRLGGSEKFTEPEVADYKIVSWTIDVPQAKFVPLSIALAGLENEEILLEVNRMQINALPENNEEQRVTMNVLALLK